MTIGHEKVYESYEELDFGLSTQLRVQDNSPWVINEVKEI